MYILLHLPQLTVNYSTKLFYYEENAYMYIIKQLLNKSKLLDITISESKYKNKKITEKEVLYDLDIIDKLLSNTYNGNIIVKMKEIIDKYTIIENLDTYIVMEDFGHINLQP
jgi:hypothetical protein